MKAIVTGSHAYGKPKKYSDLDLVVYVTRKELSVMCNVLHRCQNSGDTPEDSCRPLMDEEATITFREGKINLIATSDPVEYAVWLKGTRRLQNESGPVEREYACKIFTALRKKHGVRE